MLSFPECCVRPHLCWDLQHQLHLELSMPCASLLVKSMPALGQISPKALSSAQFCNMDDMEFFTVSHSTAF